MGVSCNICDDRRCMSVVDLLLGVPKNPGACCCCNKQHRDMHRGGCRLCITVRLDANQRPACWDAASILGQVMQGAGTSMR